MPELRELLSSQNVRCNVPAASRKRALQYIAELISSSTTGSADALFDELLARERLGSTGLGAGVAIPHCRIQCEQMHVALVSLATPIDYEASDGEAVDLLFVLVVPQDEQHAHLSALAAIAEVFSNIQAVNQLRLCDSDTALMTCMQHALAQQVPDTKSA